MKASKRRSCVPSGTALYLGVDGGGTRTVAWVSNARGRVLGRATAGASNPVKVGLAAAEREIRAAAKGALRAAGQGKLAAVCAGLAGADRAEVSGPLLNWLRKRFPAGFHEVTTDAAIALEAARGALPTIVVIAGTGSIACARDTQGNLIRSGGWGALFGDAGSGFDVGRRAVGAALRAVDGLGMPTRLIRAIPRALGLRGIRDIVGSELTSAEIAGLSPVVIRTARAGDAVAREILNDAARELADLALALIRRLGLERQPVAIVCAGGLLEETETIRQILARHLKSRVPRARVLRASRKPVQGALARALLGAPDEKLSGLQDWHRLSLKAGRQL